MKRYINDLVYESSFLKILKDLEEFMNAVLRTVDSVKMQNIKNKLFYRYDVCPVANDSHIRNIFPLFSCVTCSNIYKSFKNVNFIYSVTMLILHIEFLNICFFS